MTTRRTTALRTLDPSLRVGSHENDWMDGRHAALLRNLQVALVCLFLIAMAALLASHPDTGVELAYAGLILGLAVAVSAALVLSLMGRFTVSATLTIGVLVVPPWFSLAVDPRVLDGDFVPMPYVVFPVMIAAMFTTIRAVLVLAVAQWLGLVAVALANPGTGFNWASLLTFVIIVNVISTLYSVITRADLDEIELHLGRLRAAQAELLHESTHDALTGAYNRAYLDQQLRREVARANRNGQPFSIVMVDVDHFKAINDAVGHAGGDDALRQVAGDLHRTTRLGDSVCRFGGDEFLLLLPDADRAGATAVAELVRGSMPGASDLADLTVSLGVATYPFDGGTPDELLSAADASLYDAKRSGRNRVGRPGGQAVPRPVP